MPDLCLGITKTGIAQELPSRRSFLPPGRYVPKVVFWIHRVSTRWQRGHGYLSAVSSGSWLISPLLGSQVTLLFCKWQYPQWLPGWVSSVT